MSGNEINKGKIYVAYITMLGIPELTYALAYVVDEASANGVKVVAKHTSSNIGWAKQDIRRVYNLEKYKELFPQGYEMIDLDEIKIHCRVGFDLCADLAIDEVRKAAGLKDQMPHREEKKEVSERQETIADIIAEKRRRADEIERDCAEKMKRGEMVSDCYARELVADIRREADRLEAAHKRERGDCAKLREALRKINSLCGIGVVEISSFEIGSICDDALSASPRNCDLPKVVEDPWRAWLDDKSNWEDGNPKLEIHDWLLATATEKEGGGK